MASISQSPVVAVRRATPGDAAAVAGALANALADDPFARWCVGSDRTEHRLRAGFAATARHHLGQRDHLVYVADGSAALWKGIDAWKGSMRELLHTLPAYVRSCRWRTPRILRAYVHAEKAHPEEPHYYLAYLGTRVERQGRGLGSAVMAPMLERCDEEGVLAYLETANPRNEPFYRRLGFERQGEIAVPRGCPPVVAMTRSPR